MSLEIRAKLICDNCGATIDGEVETRSTVGMATYWDAQKKAKKSAWITVSRGRYRKPAHYCAECADKPVRKIKDPPRIRKCRKCRGSGHFCPINPETGIGKVQTCDWCNGTGLPV